MCAVHRLGTCLRSFRSYIFDTVMEVCTQSISLQLCGVDSSSTCQRPKARTRRCNGLDERSKQGRLWNRIAVIEHFEYGMNCLQPGHPCSHDCHGRKSPDLNEHRSALCTCPRTNNLAHVLPQRDNQNRSGAPPVCRYGGCSNEQPHNI